ncbi:hypothetical protein ACWA06_08695 [Serratia rhizosphaerae]|uniref:hypothetical protein n=1 Tax=unclassified Serratia (in: enterobacteria) TaxID=2647522 RepID=UPI0008FFCF0C|nr:MULTISPECIES: hypothetical protein [unclassified Serratia (in: enterobacteria)]QNK34217.1 hypothetical protein HF675_09390 [Serratia sp. JUb9]
MSSLEFYYAGDEKWKRYADFYAEDYLDDNARMIAKRLNGNLDLAVVIYGKRGVKESLWWIEQSVPALEGLKPIDCLKKPELIKRLRECVMRMP